MHLRSLALALTLLGPSAHAAGKLPLTHESMWLMKRVGAPVPSPDGRWVAFGLTQPAYDEKETSTDLWLVPTEGGAPPRQITFTKGPESTPAWSPDSRRLAFTAKREGDEAAQVYTMDVLGGGEARRVTNVTLGASSPRWSPDGTQVLFTSTVYPGARTEEENKKAHAERKARKYNARVYESFPIRHWDKWLDELQTHVFAQKAEPGAPPRDLLAGTQFVAGRGFAGVQGNGGQELQAVWTPDGQGIVLTATSVRDHAAYGPVNTHLYLVSLAGGEPKALTTGEDSYSQPRFSPDGRTLACLHTREGKYVYSLDRLALFAWPTPGAMRLATEGFDRSVASYGFSPDGRTIYLTAEESGHENLFSLPATGGTVKRLLALEQGAFSNLALAERGSSPVLVANYESAVSPIEIARLDAEAGRHRPLTQFNAERTASIDWQPLRHFTFTSKRGKTVHSMVVLPPGFDEKRKYPLFTLIHGGANLMWRDQYHYRWNYHLLASPGYVVLLTNYTGSTGFGERFAQEIQGDPLKGPGEEINEAVDAAVQRFPFVDGARLAAGGASYGGHLANWLQATTTRYKCLVSHAGLVNLESQWGTSDTIYSREITNGGPAWEQGAVWREQSPHRLAKNFKTPMLLTVGENDFRVPLNQTLENWALHQRLQVPSRLVVFPDANHWILKPEDSRFFYREVMDWLARWI